MNREIKFRAWTEDIENRMHMDYYLELHNESGMSLNNMLKSFKSHILMQYTGLKDKNGVEIYEGDIIHEVNYDLTAEVKFDQGTFKTGVNPMTNFSEKNLVVIGNIYENPELLIDAQAQS